MPWDPLGITGDTADVAGDGEHVAAQCQLGGLGISRSEFKIVAESVNNGGHVRVGLEDNLYLEKGVFASNAQLVEKAVRIMRELDAEPVEPERAAELLELLLPRSQ